MCGRYMIVTVPEAMRRLFGYLEQPNFPPRYNVAPTQPIPIVRLAEGRRQFALVRGGLIPSWVKDPRKFSLLINARADSVNDKPAFRAAMKRRRPAVGATFCSDEIRLFRATPRAFLPFIKTVRRDKTAPPPHRVAEGRLVEHGFTARVDEQGKTLGLLDPGRQQAPTHQRE